MSRLIWVCTQFDSDRPERISRGGQISIIALLVLSEPIFAISIIVILLLVIKCVFDSVTRDDCCMANTVVSP